MPQVKGNHLSGHIRFQQGHSGRVSKGMGGDAALLEERHLRRGAVDQLLKLVSGTRSGEALAEAVR